MLLREGDSGKLTWYATVLDDSAELGGGLVLRHGIVEE